MIIDFHTHIFPDALAGRALRSMRGSIRRICGEVMPVYTDGTAGGLRRSMAENGIDLSVTLPVATTARQHTSINRFARETAGSGIFPFAGIHPMQPDWAETLEGIAQTGFCGIKLHPEFQNFYIDCPESIRLLKKAEQLGLLVALHTGQDACNVPPVHCAPERLKRALRSLDGGNIIAAHLGGFNMWDAAEQFLMDTPIYMDTGVVGGYIDPVQYRRIIQRHGSEKILFASDSPWEDQRHALAALRALKLDAADEEKILGGNARRLLGL